MFQFHILVDSKKKNMQFSFMIFKEGFHFEILLIITFHFHYVKAENFEN